eukprot:s1773_g10.t1
MVFLAKEDSPGHGLGPVWGALANQALNNMQLLFAAGNQGSHCLMLCGKNRAGLLKQCFELAMRIDKCTLQSGHHVRHVLDGGTVVVLGLLWLLFFFMIIMVRRRERRGTR